MFARALGTVAFAVGFAASAWADGMPQYSRVYAPAFSWTGFYVGANVGWERKRMVGSDFDLVDSRFFSPLITDGSSAAAPTSQNLQGWIGGGQIGYNHQFGRAVIGTEFSASWNDVSGSGDCFRQGFVGTRITHPQSGVVEREVSTRNCSETQKWSVNWLNKFGVTHDRLLVYLIGGVALTEIEKKRDVAYLNEVDAGLGFQTAAIARAQWSGTQTHIGVVLGGGLQYAIGHNVSLGVEYLRTTYASADYLTRGTGATCDECGDGPRKFTFGSNAIQDGYSDTIRAVLNYKFGADHERVPLK